ncbi:MAG: TolC family protein, partial [Runella sp.]
MRLQPIFISVFCLLLLFLGGCKAPSTVFQTSDFQPIPSVFPEGNAALNNAAVPWATFFKDTNLVSLINTALSQNFEVKKLEQRILMADAQILYARGQLRPFTTFGVSEGVKRFGKYTIDGVGNFDTNFSNNISPDQRIPQFIPDLYLGTMSSWEIDVFRKLRSRRQAAIARYMASMEGRSLYITNLVADIAGSYYDLIASDLELDFIRETITLQKNQLDIIKLEKETGRGTELPVQQFEAQVLNSQGIERELVQRINLAENRINYLLGRYPQPIRRDKNTFLRVQPQEVFTGIPSDLLRNRPDIRQAELELTAAKADVAAARAAFLPSFNIGLGLGLQSFNLKYFLSPESLTLDLLGGLTAPLINRSMIKSEFNVSKAVQFEAL